MQVAFIVKLDLPDAQSIEGTSDQIQDSLSSDGLNVISIAPWARDSLSAVSSLLSAPGAQASDLGGNLNPPTGLNGLAAL